MAGFNTKHIVIFLVMGVIALVLGFYLGQYREAQKIAGGPAVLQSIELPDTEGNTRNTDEWRGKGLLINFWATWCPPCREEMPMLIAAQEKHGTEKLRVLGIAIEDAESARKYMLEHGVNYPSLVSETEAMDLMALYGNAGGLPFTLAIGPDGTIVAKKLGKFSQSELDGMIEAVLN